MLSATEVNWIRKWGKKARDWMTDGGWRLLMDQIVMTRKGKLEQHCCVGR